MSIILTLLGLIRFIVALNKVCPVIICDEALLIL